MIFIDHLFVMIAGRKKFDLVGELSRRKLEVDLNELLQSWRSKHFEFLFSTQQMHTAHESHQPQVMIAVQMRDKDR